MLLLHIYRIEFDKDKLKFVYKTIQNIHFRWLVVGIKYRVEIEVLENVNKLANDVCT